MPHSHPGSKNETAYHNGKTLDWKKGWDASRVMQVAPRYTMPVGGSTFERSRFKARYPGVKIVTGFRDTYIDMSCRDRFWVPGPKYRTQREFIDFKDDDTDANKTLKERVPRPVFSNLVRPANDKKIMKGPGRRLPSSYDTPGPGAYTQYSSFGMPSGGHRLRPFYGASDMRKTVS